SSMIFILVHDPTSLLLIFDFVGVASDQCGYSHDAVVHALRPCGIRHVDTAKRYGVKREDLWITTKLWHSDYGYQNTKKACLESCERLGVEYLGMHF
uniref:NADP-dependent oxidoreductase domain-containing protein n=1 Tax=Gallus gallus TaxID=9031 RepID=A0A8V0ZX43_CHICK